MRVILCLIMSIITLSVVVGCSALQAIQDHDARVVGDICVEPYQGYNYKTCDDLTVEADNIMFIIPAGFVTDLASIPRWYWPIMSPAKSEIIRSAIVHDYLYRCSADFSRKEADEIFYELLIKDGNNSYTAGKMFLAVRAFGWRAFHQDPRNCMIWRHDGIF